MAARAQTGSLINQTKGGSKNGSKPENGLAKSRWWLGCQQTGRRAVQLTPRHPNSRAKAGRRYLGNEGGGELVTQGRDGRFRDKDTVRPGNDPYPPKG
jgi:hypothetical protein